MGTRGKKPPAPSAPHRPDLNADRQKVYIALERLGAGPELLAIVGSWRDTLRAADVVSRSRPDGYGRVGHSRHDRLAIEKGELAKHRHFLETLLSMTPER
jgi:hypothetical protein